MLAHILKAWRQRLLLVAACALGALGWRLSEHAPPEPSVAGVAAMLGAAIGGEVAEDAFVWEPGAGAVSDFLLGRPILFAGVATGEERRDIFRARVRVSREGRPLAVASVHNLTATPLADEGCLTAAPGHAAFTVEAFDAVQAVSVIELPGLSPAGSPWQRLLLMWRNRQRFGSPRALVRTDVVFGEPPDRAQIELRDGELILALGEPPAAAVLDLGTGRLNAGAEDRHRARSLGTAKAAPPPSAVARELLESALGEATLAMASALLDGLSARVGHAFSDEASEAPPPAGELGWPPAAVAPLWAGAERAAFRPLLEECAEGTGPCLMHARVAPPAGAPIHLVAIDTRQLELRLQPGSEEPRPLAGPAGAGAIPPADRARAVAAFNGAAVAGGMVVDGRVLIPPGSGLGAVAGDAHGRTHLGGWAHGAEVPERFAWLRQAPLLDLESRDDGPPRERSALCRTRDGFLIYAWSPRSDPESLRRALTSSRCAGAVELDGGSGQVGFALLAEERPAVEDMRLDARAFANGRTRDFFYLARRDPAPATRGDTIWRPDPGAHPPPPWLPAVHRAQAEHLGVEVALYAFAPDRFAWEIRPGRNESAARTARGALSPAEQARALVAIGLGVANRRDNRRGLVLGGVRALPIRPDLGVLSIEPEGIALARTVEDLAPRGDATELVLLAEGGEIRSEARRLGPRRARAGACSLDDGTLLVAQATADSDEALVNALLAVGCRRIVQLNRGRQREAFVHRAGGDPPPQAEYDDTVLYGMAREARGRAQALTARP